MSRLLTCLLLALIPAAAAASNPPGVGLVLWHAWQDQPVAALMAADWLAARRPVQQAEQALLADARAGAEQALGLVRLPAVEVSEDHPVLAFNAALAGPVGALDTLASQPATDARGAALQQRTRLAAAVLSGEAVNAAAAADSAALFLQGRQALAAGQPLQAAQWFQASLAVPDAGMQALAHVALPWALEQAGDPTAALAASRAGQRALSARLAAVDAQRAALPAAVGALLAVLQAPAAHARPVLAAMVGTAPASPVLVVLADDASQQLLQDARRLQDIHRHAGRLVADANALAAVALEVQRRQQRLDSSALAARVAAARRTLASLAAPVAVAVPAAVEARAQVLAALAQRQAALPAVAAADRLRLARLQGLVAWQQGPGAADHRWQLQRRGAVLAKAVANLGARLQRVEQGRAAVVDPAGLPGRTVQLQQRLLLIQQRVAGVVAGNRQALTDRLAAVLAGEQSALQQQLAWLALTSTRLADGQRLASRP